MQSQLKLWHVITALAVGVNLLAAPVSAQDEGTEDLLAKMPVRDHLKCFDVEVKDHDYSTVPVVLDTDFSQEKCDVHVEPDFFCTEASKKRKDKKEDDKFGGINAGDFLCHKIDCEEVKDKWWDDDKDKWWDGDKDKWWDDDKDKWSGKKIEVSDQFAEKDKPFKLKLKDAFALCAPAEKKDTKHQW